MNNKIPLAIISIIIGFAIGYIVSSIMLREYTELVNENEMLRNLTID